MKAMENGVERAEGSTLVASNHVENEVGDGVEERVVDGMVGTSESKDVEEEVFEEAVASQEYVQQQGPKSESGTADDAGNSESVVADESSNGRPDAETFEEVIGVPSEPGKSEEVVGEEKKVGVLVGGDNINGVVVPDKVDEGGTEKDALTNELSGLKEVADVGDNGEMQGLKIIIDGVVVQYRIDGGGAENDVVANELSGGKEEAEVGAKGGMEDLKGGDQMQVESGTSINMSHNGDSCNVNLVEKQDAEKLEYSEGNGIVDGIPDSCQELEFHGEIVPENGEIEEHTEIHMWNSVDSPDASAGNCLDLLDNKGEELNGNLAKIDAGHMDNEIGELEDDISGSDPRNGDVKGVQLKSIFPGVDAEHKIDWNGEVKDASAELDLEHVPETLEVKDTSVDHHTAVEEGTVPLPVLQELESSPSSENSAVKRDEKKQAVVNNLRAQDNKVSQPQHGDEKVDEVSNNHAVADNIEKKSEKGQKEKQSTQTNREFEIQPVPEFTSSSAKATNPARPAGLGRAAPLLEPAPRAAQQPRVNGTVSHVQTQHSEDPSNGEAEENDETREKLQMIRVKFLRLAHRLGQTPHNVVVAQVLYRLGLAEQLRGRNGGRVGAFSFDRASAMAEQLEAAGQEPLDFSCTIMVLGKTGVGKSATINSIFDEVKFGTDAFQMGTKRVQDVVGTVQGIRVRVIDTPGLLPSWSDQRTNEKILHSVKRFIKKTPPDIVLYLDRLDMQSRDFGDMPLLRTITEIFGPSIWFNAIVVLTHAASAPPDGPNGTASSYDMFVTQRSHVVQQAIRQAAGDMRLMNPVSLVENHSACRTNRAGQRVLPNGQVWKPHLLLLSFASKILAEANTLLKLQDSPPGGRPFATRSRAPPLPLLLSSLLQSRPQVKLPEEQFGDEDGVDDDVDESSDSEEESEYDELPPFKPLTKDQVAKLTRAQRKAYFDEIDYREKLFMKKQLKEEKKRRKMMKKMAAAAKDLPSDYGQNVEEESGGAASVPVPMPDLALPVSFDSDNPTHRYRYLDTSNQWLVRPVLETQGWDHDVGYEGINVERLFVVKDKIPVSFSGQVTKDKKDASVQMELASSIKHGEGKTTSVGFDMQTVGKDLAYTLRSETRFVNFRKMKAAAGVSCTLLGDALSAGVKVEDKLIVNKRFQMVVTGGAMTGRGDVAYGGSLEAQLRDKDHPLGRSLSTLGISVMDWHGDLAIGSNLQTQIPVGRSTNLIARANLNNRGAGQVSIRFNSSEHLQIVLVALVPLLKKLFGYSQQMQYG